MDDFITQIFPYVTSFAIAALIYLKQHFELKKVKESVSSITDQLQKSDAAYYVICPNCGNKIELSKVQIYCQKRTEDKQNGNNN